MASRFLMLSLGAYAYNRQQTSNQANQHSEMEATEDAPRQAICILNAEKGQTAHGVVHFLQNSMFQKTRIQGEFQGLTPSHKHGFHIHQYGNLSQGCVTAGPHFNPLNQLHGGPDSIIRHVGDLGNIQADDQGLSKLDFEDHQITLHGPLSIVGRACVLHRDTDDHGTADNEESKKTGNAGPRIACGIIGLSKE
eukprot:403377282